ncbi:MAG: alcohol dehydrogenase catalytic domain-containing protein, partial [Anaerolineae bacterium]|nr:alcohol dehydrogenase catalytic domain-containing protein [Anaerolineae bacterium]
TKSTGGTAMKALQLPSVGRVVLVDLPVPAIKDDELLIRTGATTICTSDLNDVRENPFNIAFPVVMGHEAAGIVAVVGANVTGFQVGDRVAAHPVHPCGRCPACQRSWGHLCVNVEHFAINRQGTFAEYFPVRADRARMIPQSVPFTAAALAEPVSVCLEALAQAALPAGGTLLILGDGPFGILMARLAASLPLRKTVLAGWEDFRLGFAQSAVTINTKAMPNPVERLRTEAEELGYDAVILAVGSPDAVRQGIALLRPKGRFVVFSALPGETPIDLFRVHMDELEIVGACSDENRLDDAIAQLSDPTLNLRELVTHTFPLEHYAEALTLAETGHDRALKVAFVFDVDVPGGG